MWRLINIRPKPLPAQYFKLASVYCISDRKSDTQWSRDIDRWCIRFSTVSVFRCSATTVTQRLLISFRRLLSLTIWASIEKQWSFAGVDVMSIEGSASSRSPGLICAKADSSIGSGNSSVDLIALGRQRAEDIQVSEVIKDHQTIERKCQHSFWYPCSLHTSAIYFSLEFCHHWSIWEIYQDSHSTGDGIVNRLCAWLSIIHKVGGQ